MLSGVVFDLDGVIADSHPLHYRAWRAFLASVGKEVSEADLDFIREGRRRREILVHFLGELSESEIQEYGRQKDDLFLEARAFLEPVAGSVEFIKRLARVGLHLGVATAASRQRAEWTLQRFEIAKFFEAIVTGDDVAESKPDPAVYRVAAQRLSISPKHLFAVEDSVCGVRSATAAGLRCLGIGAGGNVLPLIQAGADRVLPNFANLSVEDLEAFTHPPAALSEHNESIRVSSANA